MQGEYKAAIKLYSKALRYLDARIFEGEGKDSSSASEADLDRLTAASSPLFLNRYYRFQKVRRQISEFE